MDIAESGTGICGWQQGGGLNIKEGCTVVVVVVVVVVCIGIRLVVCGLIIIPMIDICPMSRVVVVVVVIIGGWFFGSFGNDQTCFISFATMCRWGC